MTSIDLTSRRPLAIATLMATCLVLCAQAKSFGQYMIPQPLGFEYEQAAPLYSAHGLPLPSSAAVPDATRWDDVYQAVFSEASRQAGQMPAYDPHGLPYSPAASAEMQASWAEATERALNPSTGQVSLHNLPAVSPHGLPYESGGEADIYLQQQMGGGDKDGVNRWVTAQRYDDHFFDFHAEAMYYERHDSIGGDLLVTQFVKGNPVLYTNSAPLEDNTSATRLTAAVDFFNSFDVEFTYTGGLDWSNWAQVTGNNNLFSVFSGFGTNPSGGYVETGQASLAAIDYEASLDSFEWNAKWRWVGVDRPIGGAWTFGIRYLRLDERLRFFTKSRGHTDPFTGGHRNGGFMNYTIGMENDVLCFQTGGELFVTPLPSLMVGGDFEVGVGGNSIQNVTRIGATSLATSIVEDTTQTEIAFTVEANLVAVYRVWHELYLRGGYQVLLVNNLGFAANNFNSDAPFLPGRVPFIDGKGELLLHGAHIGFQYQY